MSTSIKKITVEHKNPEIFFERLLLLIKDGWAVIDIKTVSENEHNVYTSNLYLKEIE